MKKSSYTRRNHGFTIIELLVVIVILGILTTLVALAYTGVQSKNRNAQRQANIDTLKAQLEVYFAGANVYPNLGAVNDADFRKQYMKKLPADILQDPKWESGIAACTKDGKAIAAGKPTEHCYSYEVTSADGKACDNNTTPCIHYTLTAVLEGEDNYVKTSLN